MAYHLPVLCLAADLVRDVNGLRAKFDSDPFGVMKNEYHLSPAAMEAFYTMCSAPPKKPDPASWQRIVDYMWSEEISSFSVERLPDPADPDCIPPAAYPNPKPMLHKVDPLTGKTNTSPPVTIKGQGLWKSIDVFLVQGNKEYPVVVGGAPQGTYRCSHLTAPFELSGVPQGTYSIVVLNTATKPDNQREASYAGTFRVTP